MKNKILSLQDFSTGYVKQEPILEDVNLTIYEHDFIVIVGPNGGGKSTLVKSLLGLLPAYTGQLKFYQGGIPCKDLEVGYLPQRTQIDSDFPITVEEVVKAGLLSKIHWGWRRQKSDSERITQVLELVGMSEYRKSEIGALSGGQLQRVLLARAIVNEPQFIVLDEPNSYLDQQFEAQLYPLLKQLNEKTTLLIVSHEAHSLQPYLNRCIRVDGKVEELAQGIS